MVNSFKRFIPKQKVNQNEKFIWKKNEKSKDSGWKWYWKSSRGALLGENKNDVVFAYLILNRLIEIIIDFMGYSQIYATKSQQGRLKSVIVKIFP